MARTSSFGRKRFWQVGRVHRQVGRRRTEFWSSNNCRVRRGNEWHLVPVVRSLLRRRRMGQRPEQLERSRNISQSISPCRGSRPGARRFKYQVDVSYEQLSLSVRNLELRGCLLSGVGLCRLARPERLWTAIQGRTKPGYSLIGELALRGNIEARSA